MPINYPQSLPIIVSTTAPVNPKIGTQWLEVDTSNNLVGTWYWLNNAWRSEIKAWANTTIFTNGSDVIANFYKPLPSEYDYFLKHCLMSVKPDSILTSLNNISIQVTAQTNNTTPSSYGSLTVNNQSSSDTVVYKANWNYLLTSSAANKALRITFNRSQGAYANITTEYYYQAIRK